MVLDANDSTEFPSDTDDTACVMSPNAKFIILSQFVTRVDSLSEYWKWTPFCYISIGLVCVHKFRVKWCS